MKSKNIYFILFFVYVIFQGALRKWYMPSLRTPLYLMQYVLLFLFYFNIKDKKIIGQPSLKPVFEGFLILYITYCILEIFNFRGTENFIVPIYGLIMHLAFVPLVFFMAKALQTEESLDQHLMWLAYLLLPVFFLGITQYFLPQDSYLNRYATEQADGEYEVVLGAGGRVRIAGTFSYLATYASFLTFILHILFYGAILSLLKKRLNWYFAVAYGMGVTNLFMTGSRGPTVVYALSEAIAIVILISSGHAKFLKNLIPLGILFVGGYFILQSTNAGSTSVNDFFDRFNSTSDIEGRLDDSFAPFKFADMCGPIGFGIGTGQFPMAPYLTNRWEMPAYWEEEGERIVLELGVIGYIIIMALRWYIAFACYRIFKQIRKLEYKILAVQMTAFQLPFLINLQTNIFNYIDGLFYWMAVGLVYFAYVMDKKYKQKMDVQAENASSIPQIIDFEKK